MDIIQVDHAICDKERADYLFAGDIIVYKQRPAMHELIQYCHKLLHQALGLDPVYAQKTLGKADFIAKTSQVQDSFKKDNKAKQLFFEVLRECGVNTHNSLYDHFPLRVVPAQHQHNTSHRSSISHHRDTWGSNLQAQQNWWAPLYTLSEERTIAFFPDYWDKPLANNTADWSFDDYLAKRKIAIKQNEVGYPIAPTAGEQVDESHILKLVIDPGDVLNFSSAHLHASVPNTTDAARFSVEMRTLNLIDLKEKRAAPNIDNAGQPPMLSWFKAIPNN
jgi:hypothetical protein